MVVVSNNIELFLKKIGRSARVNKTDFGIFASEHSEIDGEDIVEIKTDPPNAWIRKGGKIKFIYPCRIYDVQMKEGAVVESAKVPEFLKEKMGEVLMNQELVVKKQDGGTIILDSSIDLISSNLFKCTKGGGSVVMTAVGKFCIPISALQPYTKYNLEIHARPLNGNGRLGIQVINSSGKVYFDAISNSQVFNTQFYTLDKNPSDTFSVCIYRPAKMSTGNISVEHIKIWEEYTDKIKQYAASPEIEKIKNYNTTSNNVELNNINPNNFYSNNKTVEEIFRNFAVLYKGKTESQKLIEEKINVSGLSSRFWLNKVQKTYPKIKNETSEISICDASNVIDAERVWIGEFDSVPNFILPNAKIIFTPSLINKIQLQTIFPDKQIRLLGRPWPKLNINRNVKDYALYFEKNKEFTNHMLNIYASDLKLHLVGVRGKLPNYATYISEYDSYMNIYKEICGAKVLIDFSENKNYQSGLINLALHIGVPVITNNHEYIGKTTVIKNNINDLASKELFNSALSSEKNISSEDMMLVLDFIKELKND